MLPSSIIRLSAAQTLAQPFDHLQVPTRIIPVRRQVGRRAKGNDKGKVEDLAGHAQRNYMVPIRLVPSWEESNAHLEQQFEAARIQAARE